MRPKNLHFVKRLEDSALGDPVMLKTLGLHSTSEKALQLPEHARSLSRPCPHHPALSVPSASSNQLTGKSLTPRTGLAHSTLCSPQSQPSLCSVTTYLFAPLVVDQELLENSLHCILLTLSAWYVAWCQQKYRLSPHIR